jgi:excinuclease UvrABC nuclease subunit
MEKQPKKDYFDAVREFALTCQGRKKPYFQKLQERKKQAKLRKAFEELNVNSPEN